MRRAWAVSFEGEGGAPFVCRVVTEQRRALACRGPGAGVIAFDVVVEAAPLLARFVGQEAKRLGEWLRRTFASVSYERLTPRIAVSGSRDWIDAETIKERLLQLRAGSIILHGGCRGADTIAAELAAGMGLGVEEFPAAWQEHGRRAGPLRNGEMLRAGADGLLAFHDDIERSKGTGDAVRQARAMRLPVEIILSRSARIECDRRKEREARERAGSAPDGDGCRPGGTPSLFAFE